MPLDYYTPEKRGPFSRWRLMIAIAAAVLIAAMLVGLVVSQIALRRERARALAQMRLALAAYASATSQSLSSASATTRLHAVIPPAVAIWRESAAPRDWPRNESVVIVVWSDGTILWREQKPGASDSYRTAQVDRAHVDQLLADLDAAGFFASPEDTINVGPDASYTVIAARHGGKRKWFGTWHDPPPTDPNIVITDRGIERIEQGQPRPQPSAEYQQMIDTYDRARTLIEAIVPDEGTVVEPIDVKVLQDAFAPRAR